MHKPPLPKDEAARLATLQKLKLLDTDFEERYDRITRMAQRLFGVPIALLSLVDRDRQWFKSCQGLNVRETPRDISFCGHAILGDQPLIVDDATNDERFHDNPLVVNDPAIRFYAGEPIKSLEGSKIGTLCIIDRQTRHLSDDDIATLHDLAAMVEHEIHNIELAEEVAGKTRDLTVALDMAEQANQEKSRFLANMSHELRTPMHAILSFSDLGLKKACNDASAKYFGKIQSSAVRLTELIDNLLDMSKLEAGRMEVDYAEHDLAEVIKQQVDAVGGLVDKKSIRIDCQQLDQVSGWFDARLLSHVILNLLSNAIKYSPDGSQIRIRCAANHKMLRGSLQDVLLVTVEDDGIGIPVQELDSIFDRFVQSSYTASEAGGTGLGLPISQEIIRLHRGQIWAESPINPETGQGSAFYFEIPAAKKGNSET